MRLRGLGFVGMVLLVATPCWGQGAPVISLEIRAELRANYLETLDRLAKLPRSSANDTVIGKTCGKLIVNVASKGVMAELEANEGTGFYYLVGKCIQIQRFRTSDIPLKVDAYDRVASCVATEKRVPIFNELCRRAGLIR